MLELGGEAATI